MAVLKYPSVKAFVLMPNLKIIENAVKVLVKTMDDWRVFFSLA